MRSTCLSFVAAAVLACTGGTALAQSPVGNSGFETNLTFDTPPALGNWVGFFGGSPSTTLFGDRDNTAPRTGASALRLSASGDANAFVGHQQPISGVQPGVTYEMKIWARSAGAVNNGVEFRFEWTNIANGFIGNQFGLNTPIQGSLTNQYQEFTLQAVAPAEVAGVNLVLAVQTFTFNVVTPLFDTSVYFDDVSFAAISLPTQNACCFVDGPCQVALIGACPPNSTPLASGSVCSPNGCPQPSGSCCLADGSCSVVFGAAACSGTFTIAGVCSPNPCPQPIFTGACCNTSTGACCNTSTGACAVVTDTACASLGGTFSGNNTLCVPNPCTPVANCPADFNNSGGVSVQDIFDFLSAYFAGC